VCVSTSQTPLLASVFKMRHVHVQNDIMAKERKHCAICGKGGGWEEGRKSTNTQLNEENTALPAAHGEQVEAPSSAENLPAKPPAPRQHTLRAPQTSSSWQVDTQAIRA
jgi:hypothetical protein